MTPTLALARYVEGLQYDDIPPEVMHHIKLCLLDGLGCGLFGATLPWSRILADFVGSRGGLHEARVWGSSHRVPADAAVLANGTSLHGFEMDDLHPRSIVHPGSVTIPVVLALGEARGLVSGKEALLAMVAGYELSARVGMALGAAHLRRGFHPTGTIGTFAAAATAGKVLRLPAEQLVHALGIAGTQAAGLMAAQYSSMVKRMHAGRAAQSGVYGALLAERGFTGISNILEAEYGGFCSTYTEACDWAALTAGLENRFETLNVGFKPYPCCGSNHTSLDAVKELLTTNGIRPDQIAQVRIHTTHATYLHVGWEYRPESVTTAQMNLSYCVGALLRDGELFVDQFLPDRLADPDILSWIRRIEISHDPQLDALGDSGRHAVRVEIALLDGKVHATQVRHAWGSAHRPMKEEEVRRKFALLVGRVHPPEAVGKLVAAVDTLEKLADVKDLVALL
jgi:aconitate decarboxylase